MSNAFSQTEQPSNQYISAESMQIYAQTVISTYNEYISHYFPSIAGNFSFYSTSHYRITSYISYNGGALWFEPSNIQSSENFNLSNRIESIFGGDFSLFPMFSEPANAHDVSIKGGTFELNNHPFLELGDNATIVLQDILVIQRNFTQSYTCVIMKASNETSRWTKSNAIADAGTILYNDAGDSFSTSEAVREYYAEPVLTALLESIQNKLANDTSYTASEWLADLKNVENVATNTYHLANANAFINGIIAFLNAKITGILPTFPEPTQTPPVKTIFNRPVDDPHNWLYVACLGGLPVLDFAFFLFIDYGRKKRPSKLAKWALVIPPTVLSFILIDLLYYYPYDYQISSAQSFVIVVLWVLGPILLFKGGKRLSRWLVMKQKASKQTKKNPNQKAEKTRKTKDVN
jgi:hypothetical protein